jgi:hypothetical protein
MILRRADHQGIIRSATEGPKRISDTYNAVFEALEKSVVELIYEK